MAEVFYASRPPDWNTFTLDLFCPRCDYNLRMLTGSRCPECGLGLDWPRIVAAAEKRVENPLFEYRWRERPVQSFFVTIGLCLRPWKLWSRLPIADTPRMTGLLLFVLLFYSLYALFSAAVGALEYSMLFMVNRPSAILRGTLRFFGTSAIEKGVECFIQLSIVLLIWLFLHIFQQTISKYRIKPAQLWRIVILAYTAGLFVKLLSVLRIIPLYPTLWWKWKSIIPVVDGAIEGLAAGAMVASLALGLSRYLQVRRGWAVAISVAILTLLTVTTIDIALSVGLGSWDNPVNSAIYGAWPGLTFAVGRLLGLN